MLAAQLTTDDVRHHVRQRQTEGAADATINRELATLRRIFKLGLQSTPLKVLPMPVIPMLKENNVRRGFVEDGDFTRLAAEGFGTMVARVPRVGLYLWLAAVRTPRAACGPS
jgi:hypothetical protein